MKCRLRIDMERINPEFQAEEAARRARLFLPYRVPHRVIVPTGTIVEHPHSHILVLRGIADPADEECEAILDDHIAHHEIEWESREEYLACMQDDYERLARGQATGDHFYDAEDNESDELE